MRCVKLSIETTAKSLDHVWICIALFWSSLYSLALCHVAVLQIRRAMSKTKSLVAAAEIFPAAILGTIVLWTTVIEVSILTFAVSKGYAIPFLSQYYDWKAAAPIVSSTIFFITLTLPIALIQAVVGFFQTFTHKSSGTYGNSCLSHSHHSSPALRYLLTTCVTPLASLTCTALRHSTDLLQLATLAGVIVLTVVRAAPTEAALKAALAVATSSTDAAASAAASVAAAIDAHLISTKALLVLQLILLLLPLVRFRASGVGSKEEVAAAQAKAAAAKPAVGSTAAKKAD
jgi:hypothetical protein